MTVRLDPREAAPAVLTGAANRFPPARTQAELWCGYFAARLPGDRWAERVFMRAGVERRHTVVDPTVEDLSKVPTGTRMRRYVAEGAPLARQAVAAALADAGVRADEVGLLVVATCTGYASPGIDVNLINDLGLSPSMQRLMVGHMGCLAAIPGLGAAADHVVARGSAAVLLCLELTSLHVQPDVAAPPNGRVDLDQVLCHALFGDAAAAIVLQPGSAPGRHPGLAVVDVAAWTDPASADLLTWDVTDTGFRMGLSRRVPEVLARVVGPLVDALCRRNGISAAEVASWAVHPGGPRVLDVIGERLRLPESALGASRAVLAKRGNCSSATVLMVLDEIHRQGPPAPGQWVVALAVGPGLTVSAALLRAT